jgi:hypothetical protein
MRARHPISREPDATSAAIAGGRAYIAHFSVGLVSLAQSRAHNSHNLAGLSLSLIAYSWPELASAPRIMSSSQATSSGGRSHPPLDAEGPRRSRLMHYRTAVCSGGKSIR